MRSLRNGEADGHVRGSVHGPDQFVGATGLLFEQAMAQTRMAVCLADPHQADCPIVFANRAFRDLTGYEESELIGRNCRFLQGPRTSPQTIARIAKAIADEDVLVVEILNYRKDGTPFWNALHLGPIYDAQGRLIYFFGSQWDVTEVHAARADEAHARAMARELSHRIKNLFAVIGGIVTVTGRARGIEDEARQINERIQALGRAHEPTLDDASQGVIEIGPAIRAILNPYDISGDRIHFAGNRVLADANLLSTLGLALHELATNAIKYGALSTERGSVTVDWQLEKADPKQEPTLVVTWEEAGGPHVGEPAGGKGTGLGIIDMLMKAAGGTLTKDWQSAGLKATVRIPGAAA